MIDVEVEAEAWTDAVANAEAIVRETAEAALGARQGDVTVLLADDAEVQALNARFRGKDRPTNVLSFPAAESARPHLGDIALAYGVCSAEAQAQGKALAHHLAHLVAHGVLHLLGYDHEADADAAVMEDMEREILRRFGIADPYAPRDADAEP